MLKQLSAAALGLVVAAAGAQGLVGARALALSPDGSRLAFVYRGDIWIASSEGGQARPITTHVELDDTPVWSPDGKTIAFSSNRHGSSDIFTIPADGGQVRRITFHAENEAPSDWTPDGKAILFRGNRGMDDEGIFTVDVETRRLRLVTSDFRNFGRSSISNGAFISFSPDGKRLLFPRMGFIWTRPRYHGSAAQQLWTLDLQSGRRTVVRNNGFQHLWPRYGPRGQVYAVTPTELTPSVTNIDRSLGRVSDNVARTPNVYEISPDGRARRLTDFVGGSVRFLTVAKRSGMIAFEYEGAIYTMKPGEKPVRIALTAAIDDKFTNEERLVFTTGAETGTIDPKGERIAFVQRGEIWTVPVKKGRGPNADDATQMSNWPGLDDGPLWTADGKGLFFLSDREGERRVYRMDVETKAVEPVSRAAADATGLQLSPDGRRLSYVLTGPQGGLFTVPVEGGAPTQVIPISRSPGLAFDYAWSPDGRYVAYNKPISGNTINVAINQNIWIYDTQTKTEVNVTRLNAIHSDPYWTPDGKYLLFASNRQGPGLYALPLTQEIARQSELDPKWEAPKGPVTVQIDFDDIHRRIRRLIGQGVGGPIRMDPSDGSILFLSDGDIWRANYAGEESRRLSPAGGGIARFEFSGANDVFFIRGGALNIMSLRGNNAVTNVAYRADWTRDVVAERRAAFMEFWREYNRQFYDANFHGRDWLRIRERYMPLLESVAHRAEFATLLNMMVGELEASHTEAGPAPGGPTAAITAHLGFEIDFAYDGPGVRVKSVPRRSPGSFVKTRLEPGDLVLQINGRKVETDEMLWSVLANEAGRDITLLVNKTASLEGARTVRYRALSGAEWTELVARNRIEDRRAYVEKQSNGRLAYVHISGMGQNNFETFNLEAWEFVQGKEGVLIDVRDNGGGNIADRLIDILERRPHSLIRPRDGAPATSPFQSWGLPTVILHSETSLSNAEMFPSAMRARGLATLVGMPTPGYVIWTYGFRLVDGTSARMPSTGAFRLDGTPMENMGQKPDYMVDQTNEDYMAGRDPQLDKAIEVGLRQLRGR
jgi:Tol biopolymer transport system component/C-terminal processing protease CtpA/Prc